MAVFNFIAGIAAAVLAPAQGAEVQAPPEPVHSSAAPRNPLPFESGGIQIDVRHGPAGLICATRARGAAFEEAASELCSHLPSPGVESAGAQASGVGFSTTFRIARDTEEFAADLTPAGERLHEVRADLVVTASGVIASCRIVEEHMEVVASFWIEHGTWCRDATANVSFLPAANGDTRDRRGRISVVTAMLNDEPRNTEPVQQRRLEAFDVPLVPEYLHEPPP